MGRQGFDIVEENYIVSDTKPANEGLELGRIKHGADCRLIRKF